MKLEKEIKLSTSKGLRAELNMHIGGMHIIGRDEEESLIRVKLDSFSTITEEEEIGDWVDINYDEESNTLSINQTEKSLKSKLRNLRLEVNLPSESEVSAVNVNGGIKAENIILDQDYKLTNGGIKCLSGRGRLEIRSVNGGVKVLDHEGELALEQVNGGISIQDCNGRLNINTGNGGVKLNHCRGQLELKHKNGGIKSINSGFKDAVIETQNSNVYYEFSAEVEEGKFSFKNKQGKIHLIMPGELPYDALAKNELGKVLILMDKEYEKLGENNKEFHIVNGSGKVKINIENKRGNILLSDELHIHEDVEGKISRKVEVLLKEKIIPTLEGLTSENAPRIQEQIRKAGEKLRKIEINIPDIETKINKVLEQVSDSITSNLEENSEDIEKFKDATIDKVNKVWENVSEFVGKKGADSQTPQSEQAKDKSPKAKADNVTERSRLKILELLEKGTISSDEAEKLLKALSGSEDK